MIDFPRYLASKKTVDDRAINRVVWEQLLTAITSIKADRSLRVLEVGCGIGTMVERLLDWGFQDWVDYLGIDTQTDNIQNAKTRLFTWGIEEDYQVEIDRSSLILSKGSLRWNIQFQVADIREFSGKDTYQGYFDLLIAQAFLDLIDVQKILPNLVSLLSADGYFYFTLNFDGITIFEPVSDPDREAKIIECYHQSMDERLIDGHLSGDSHSGRHLFGNLQTTKAQILGVGASDWVVYPGSQGYQDDEEYFLHCILNFFENTLIGYPQLDQKMFEDWLEERREQVEQGELIYIAHQLDFVGKVEK